MSGSPCFCLFCSSEDYGALPKGSLEIGDGGRSGCTQCAKEISEIRRLLSWTVNSGALTDKKLQPELERV